MRKKLLYLVAFACSFSMSLMAQDSTATCTATEVVLTMTDSWGDGWDSGTAVIADADGNEIFSGTAEDAGLSNVASSTEATLCLTDGVYSIVVGGSSYESEMSFVLGDLASGGAGTYNFVVGEVTIPGCTDATALNFDALANEDDGSCIAVVAGCTDTTATNFNEYANEDDGSCTYPYACAEGEYILTLTDSYGDGWGTGNELTVNGIVYSLAGAGEDVCIAGDACLIILGNAGGSWASEASWSIVSETADVASGDLSYIGTVGVCTIPGCTDATALNYDATATEDDASCIAIVEGCMNADYAEYNADANVDNGSCATLNCDATIITMGGGSFISETSYTIANCDGSVIHAADAEAGEYCIVLPADYSITMVDSYGDGWNGNILNVGGVEYTVEVSSNVVEMGSCGVYGCMDSTAFNFNADATVDDESCEAVAYGCIDPIAENFNTDANTSDESCTYVAGCTDATAVNYMPSATEDDGSCQYVSCLDTDALLTFTMGSYGGETSLSIIGMNGQELAFIQGGYDGPYTNNLCLSPENSYTAILMDSYGDGWNGATFSVSTCEGSLVAVEGTLLAGSLDSIAFAIQSCDSYTFGCMDSIASNYDTSATEDDGSCTYPGCTDAMYLEFDASANLDDASCLTLIVEGCMDATASNYSADANVEDGSCILAIACDSGLVGMVIYMEDSWGDGWNGNEYSLVNSMGDLVGTGTIQTGSSAQDTLCVAADCYAISVAGGSYISEVSWSITTEYNGASVANGAGDAVAFGLGSDGDCSLMLGCNDSYATNYNEVAVVNDGSCEYVSSVTCEEAIAMDVNSSYSGAFNEQVWFSITLEGQQFVTAAAMPAAGFFYVGDVAFMTACDSTGVAVEQGVMEAGTYYISVNNSSTWANGDGYVLTVNAADVVEGCTDLYADNYNELSNIDDASCLYPCEGIPATLTINAVSYGSELYWELLNAEGMVAAYGGPYANNSANEVPVCLTSGMDYTMNAYDSYGDGWNGGTYEVIATCGEDSTAFTYIVANNGGVSPTDGEFGLNGELYALESTELFTVVPCADVVAGCMDETMFNYDSLANVSSGACEAIVYGCMDAEALNFNANANTDNASCVYGCDGEYVTVNVTTGSWASEVSWELLSSLGDTLLSGTNLVDNTPYSEQICLPIGDSFVFASHDSYGDGWNGGFFSVVSCETIMEGGVQQVGDVPSGAGADYPFTVIACSDIVPGCTNVQAENFNLDATHSDGSCVFAMPNILTPSCGSVIDLATADSTVFTWEALIGEGSAPAYYYIMWSTDSTDLVGSAAIIGNTYSSDDSLMFVDQTGLYDLFIDNGYGAGSEFNLYMWVSSLYYNAEGADTQFANNGCQITLTVSDINGCDDESAINFNPDATLNDGTCIYPCDSTQATLMMYNSYGYGWSDASLLINYEEYSFDDGELAMSCVDIDTTGCITFGWNGWGSSASSWVLYNDSAEVLASGGAGSIPENMGECAEGCMDEAYLEFDQNADVSVQDMCINFLCAGDIVSLDLVDSYGDGWNGGTITVDGSDYTMGSGSAISHGLCVDLSSCIEATYTAGSYSYENSWSISDEAGNVLVEAANVSGLFGDCGVFGCTDVTATNFDELATTDDGSCYWEGCTDPTADNYNVDATVDDGSCMYSCPEGTAQVDVLVSTDGYANETDFSLTDGTDTYSVEFTSANNTSTVTSTFCVENGSMVTFTLTDSYGDGIVNGGYQIYVCEESIISNFSFSNNSVVEEFMVACGEIAGCMDMDALNYNELATISDDSCEYPFVCDGVTAQMVLTTGSSFGEEMGWSISNSESVVVASGEAGAYTLNNAEYLVDVCLVEGADYNFNMSDSFGDGWNGGTFALTADCGELAAGGLESGFAESIAFTACGGSTGCDVPASWMVTVTGSNHSVFVPGDAMVTVDDVQVANGSAIGVFFTNSNGDLQCAGYTTITGSTIQLAVMGDDTTTDEVDGLVAGEALTWMIWDGTTCTEVAATAIYSGGADVYTTNAITFVESIASVPAGPTCQTLDIPAGWSMFSTYMMPANMDLVDVLAPIVDNVEIVKNNSGSSYLTAWGFNGIGSLVVGQGYQIKTDAAVSLEICGDYAFPEDNAITLTAGWNMIGYLRTEPSDALAVLADINATGNLVIAKNYSGQAYLPQWGFNGIGDMVPGEGYQLKTTDADVLNYLSNDEMYVRTSSVEVSNPAVAHFATVAATDNNMTVVIEDAAWDVLPTEGAEIAAFDKAGNLIGSAVYSSPLTVMAVWGDDATTVTKDGSSLAENVSFKVWSNNSTSSFEVANWVEGSASYDVNAINIANAIVTNVLADVIATERVLVKVVNVLGQEVISNEESFKGEVLFNVYNDGTVEKIVK